MNNELRTVYEQAKDGTTTDWRYTTYCNRDIAAKTDGENSVVVRWVNISGERRRLFSIRDVSVHEFLDWVAEWIVTGCVNTPNETQNPFDW